MEDNNVPEVEETEVLEETNEEQPSEAVEPEEETQEPTEQAEEQEPEAEPIEEPADEEPEPKPSRRENLRIQQLLEKMKYNQEPGQPVPQQGMDYASNLDADPEVVRQLEEDRRQAAQTSYQQGLDQAKSIQFHTRLELDAPKVEQKYPILNKESEEFNPAVADAVNSWYLQMTGYNPATNSVSNANIRYSEFIEGVMELGEKTAGQKVAQSSKQIARQAAQTGIRPDGSQTKKLDLTKAPQDMTDEELNAVVKQSIR